MASSGVSRRQSFKQTSAEAQALRKISQEAEARLAADKQARRDARCVRTRELERQQVEEEHKKLGHIPRNLPLREDALNKATVSLNAGCTSPTGSNTPSEAYLLLMSEFVKLQGKLRKAEDLAKHLDGEMLVYRYEVELRKDEIDDLQEEFINVEYKKKEHVSELTKVKQSLKVETEKCDAVRRRVQLTVNLMRENGLLKSSEKSGTPQPASNNDRNRSTSPHPTTTNLSVDRAQILQGYSGTLEDRLKQICIEKEAAEKQVIRLKAELQEAHDRSSMNGSLHSPTPTAGSSDTEISADVVKQLNEYRFKLKKSEQDITTLEGNSGRLETQMLRYKLASETLEKSEEELKGDRRKLQRELREARIQIEELSEQNGGLKNRLEKLKKDKVTATK